MDVHWLEQTEADLPAHDDWLGASEALVLGRLRFPKRRADWRLGRWTAKHAVAGYLNQPLAAIEIRASASGAPEVFTGGERAAVTISLSHRGGVAACAVAFRNVALGCDLEIVEPRSEAFAGDYFTAAEQALIAGASAAERLRMLALLWSGKESVLKAMRMGLRLDPRSVAVEPGCALLLRSDDAWRPLQACHETQVFDGWWRQTGALVRTMVAVPAPDPPRTWHT